MAMEFPSYSGFGDPRPALEGFLYALRYFFQDLITSTESPKDGALFREEFVSDLKEAWGETQVHFDTAIKRLYMVDQSDIEAHGLVGVALRLKLRLVHFFHERYKQKGKVVLGKLFNVMDGVVLDSILDMLKVSKAISEFKEATKAALLLDH
jgi:hypothetical protein